MSSIENALRGRACFVKRHAHGYRCQRGVISAIGSYDGTLTVEIGALGVRETYALHEIVVLPSSSLEAAHA